jgi:SNF2 family DNA or RNA helicase
MVDWIIKRPHCALFADMGLGKTVATLTAIRDLWDGFDITRVLIVAPLRVALSTWPNEIKLWSHTRDLTYTQLAGLSPQGRRTALLRYHNTTIHIINREMLTWLVDFYKSKWPYDVVVIDESSSFKDPSTKRFKSLVKIIHAVGLSRVIELTGTPASNGLLDLWAQIFLLDQGKRLGPSFNSYKERFFYRVDSEQNNRAKWLPRGESKEVIYNKLRSLCLRLSADDYLNMPEKIINNVVIDLPAKARQQYDILEKEFLLDLENNDKIVAEFAASLTNKLLQFANGAVYIDDTKRFEVMHDAKLDALDDIIEEAAGQPVLVAYSFQSDKKRILERFPTAVALDKNPDTITRWNNGEIPILVMHPASGGHGLNIQYGGNVIVWFGLNWSLELYLQLNARLHRQGQTKPVFIHRIVASDTIDDTVIDALAGKYHTQEALLNALRGDVGARLAA